MKCLSVRNPWAHAIIHLGKSIENRMWRTKYRGPLAIHTGRADAAAASINKHWPSEIILPERVKLAYGAIIGIVDLIDCVPAEDVCDDPWTIGPWCWILANPRPITPVPMAGRLQIFDAQLAFN